VLAAGDQGEDDPAAGHDRQAGLLAWLGPGKLHTAV
jgi:hypothetical protein